MSERRWARKQVLASADFRELVKEVDQHLGEIPYCLIGGLAVAYYANPPVTIDADFLVDVDGPEDLARAAKGFAESGFKSAPLRFVHRQKGLPRRGIRFYRKLPATDIDLIFTGGDDYLEGVVLRSGMFEVQSTLSVPIARPEDIVVLKTLVGRSKDIEDTVAIVDALGNKLNQKYIDKMVEELT